MLFSIIMPAYNAECFLAKSIDSVLQQTYSNWELILINDGSRDNTDRIAQEYAKRESRLRYFVQENHGVSATRNRGIELAAGEYVLFLDADDEIDSRTLETVNNVLEQDPCDIVTFNMNRTDVNSQVTGKVTEPFAPHRLRLCDEEEKKCIYSILASEKSFGMMGLFVVRREVISNLRFRTDMMICEDMLFDIAMYEAAESIVCLPDYFYYYRDNPAGCIRNFNFRKIEDVKIAYRAKLALAERHQLQENIKIIDMWFCLAIVSLYSGMLENRTLRREYLEYIKRDEFIMQRLFRQQEWSEEYPPIKLLTGNKAERAVLRGCWLLRRKAERLLQLKVVHFLWQRVKKLLRR